jgi:hypothetical protein
MRRLGELHREAAEERQKKVAELEGIVQEFRQHIKVGPAKHAFCPVLDADALRREVFRWGIARCI